MERVIPPHLWPEEGKCYEQADPELFFPAGEKSKEHRSQIEEAKSYCRRCDMAELCLAWAMAKEDHGVWGGMSANERRAVKRRNSARKSRAA
ncbi:MAG TPA: WhiB family transcriptional regulator [Candidatus Saccharimonadales bacterium]|nr:WhiB family transcriptional regulator [Candidatus Saccharimonadales bacterium]